MAFNPCESLSWTLAGALDITPSATLAINEKVGRLKSSGKQVYHLGFGESRFPLHPLLAQALRNNVHRRSYLSPLGLPELRETIATYYQQKFHLAVEPYQVVTGIGSKSLLFLLLQCQKGRVLLPTPCWVSYPTQAQLARRKVNFLQLQEKNGYRFTKTQLEEVLERIRDPGKNADTLIVTTPNNPTGTVSTRKEVKEIAVFARRHNMLVLSDEIYALLNYTQGTHISPAHYYPEGTAIFGGLSKHLSLGGWRFGVVILPPGEKGKQLEGLLRALAGSIWTCVPGPIQYAALVAYSNHPEIEAYIDTCTKIHGIRTRYLYKAFLHLGISCPEPQGGFYLYPSFNSWRKALAGRRIRSSENLAEYLLDQYGLVVLAGSFFGDAPTNLTLRVATSYIDTDTDEQSKEMINFYGKQPDSRELIERFHPQLQRVAERFADFINDLERGT